MPLTQAVGPVQLTPPLHTPSVNIFNLLSRAKTHHCWYLDATAPVLDAAALDDVVLVTMVVEILVVDVALVVETLVVDVALVVTGEAEVPLQPRISSRVRT